MQTGWGRTMWPDRRLCELLKIDHPIIQAPMLGSCTPELALAVSHAGALGSLACGGKAAGTIEEEVAQMRRATNRGFNLNFFIREVPHTDPQVWARTRERVKPWFERYHLGEPPHEPPQIGPGFGDEQMALLLRLKPAVVSFHFGHPGADAIARLREAGIVVISSATCVSEAVALARAGVDAIIAQGWEAGGHRGSHRRTAPSEGVGVLSLVPQVVDAVEVPVIAAGGIGDGRGIAAAFALGACGVQMGTAFLSCPEAATDDARRERIRHALDTDTMFTDAFSGRSARAMRSRFAEEMARHGEPLPDFLHMRALSEPIRQAAGDDEASFLLYGQSAVLNREMPAADLVARLCEEARSRFSGLASA